MITHGHLGLSFWGVVSQGKTSSGATQVPDVTFLVNYVVSHHLTLGHSRRRPTGIHLLCKIIYIRRGNLKYEYVVKQIFRSHFKAFYLSDDMPF